MLDNADDNDFELAEEGELCSSTLPLKGKTLTKIEHVPDTDTDDVPESLIFFCSEGDRYRMTHDQGCCEHVYLESTCGDLKDLIGAPLTVAEERSFQGTYLVFNYGSEHSVGWTYYHFSTTKGSVVLCWRGDSTIYYSVDVSLRLISD